jgi:ketopantoate reductase
MQVAVIGAGAVGCYYGALLLRVCPKTLTGIAEFSQHEAN